METGADGSSCSEDPVVRAAVVVVLAPICHQAVFARTSFRKTAKLSFLLPFFRLHFADQLARKEWRASWMVAAEAKSMFLNCRRVANLSNPVSL